MTYKIKEQFGDTWFDLAEKPTAEAAQQYMAEVKEKAIKKGYNYRLQIVYNDMTIDNCSGGKKEVNDENR